MRLPLALLLGCLALPAPAREIAGTLTLPEGTKLPDGTEILIRLAAPGIPPQDLRRPATDLSFALTTPATGQLTLTAAVFAEGRPLLSADPLAVGADATALTLPLLPAILPGNAAPFRCAGAPVTVAPDPGGVILHRDGRATPLAGPPEGPFSAGGLTLTRAGNRLTLALDGTPVACLPDIPPPILPLSASGTEPVWSAAVSRTAMALAMADGGTDLGQAPDLRPVPGGLVIFAAPDMNLTLGPGPCADAATLAIRPFSATFAMPGLTLTGCAGDPARALAGRWVVTGLAGLPLDGDTRPSLAFDGATLSGDTGCNRLTAPVLWQDPGLAIGPVATTRRACPATAPEARLLQALPSVTHATWDERLSVVRLMAGQAPAVTLARPAAN